MTHHGNSAAPQGTEIKVTARQAAIQKDLRAVLEMPPYKRVMSLERESRQPDGGRVAEVLDVLAAISPFLAAMTFADLCGQRLYQESIYTDLKTPAQELQQIIQRCTEFDAIREAMRTLPTLDALECRRRVLGFKNFEAIDPTAAVLYAVMEPTSIPPHLKDMYQFFTSSERRDEDKAHARFLDMAKERCLPVTATPTLSKSNQAVLDEFTKVMSPPLFSMERYGYGTVAEFLEVVPGHREVWRVRNPWGESPDAPAASCHQCADSAPAARSFFVSKGIPADVFVMILGGVRHNVCVAYFQENLGETVKTVPVLVDASPFGGFYTIEYGSRPYFNQFNNALSTGHVMHQRSTALAFVGGDLLGVDDAGLLPWCCEELPSGRGRVVPFGGVEAYQKKAGWFHERGTSEYHGHGARAPYVGMTFCIMPGVNANLATPTMSPFISVDARLEGDQIVIARAAKEADEELVGEIRTLAAKHLPDVKKFVARCGYDLSERKFAP
jgi:hypothetical protein